MLSASKPSSGRIAATGGILAARRAGTITDSIVMPTPTRNGHDDRARQQHGAVSGKPAPAALKTAIEPRATRMPPPMPSDRGDRPTSPAPRRRSSAAPGCRAAPTARISASSRSRWPIVIWNTLLMRKALTKAVTKAKPEQAVAERADDRVDARALLSSIEHLAGDRPRCPAGSISSIRACTVGRVGALVDGDVDAVELVAGAE